jgi:hypothetical protein
MGLVDRAKDFIQKDIKAPDKQHVHSCCSVCMVFFHFDLLFSTKRIADNGSKGNSTRRLANSRRVHPTGWLYSSPPHCNVILLLGGIWRYLRNSVICSIAYRP